LKFSVSLRLCGGVLQGGDLWSGEFGDLQGGVICRRCNAKAVNLAGGEVRCGEIGAVISSAETSEAVKCSAPGPLIQDPQWSQQRLLLATTTLRKTNGKKNTSIYHRRKVTSAVCRRWMHCSSIPMVHTFLYLIILMNLNLPMNFPYSGLGS